MDVDTKLMRDSGFRQIIRTLHEVETQARELRDRLEAGGQDALDGDVGVKIVELNDTTEVLRTEALIWGTITMLDHGLDPFDE
jgi:hypothetical protein